LLLCFKVLLKLEVISQSHDTLVWSHDEELLQTNLL